jgi:hypothetical protein
MRAAPLPISKGVTSRIGAKIGKIFLGSRKLG